MRPVDEEKLREFETWLSLLTDGDLPERHKWKAWFCVAEYEQPDFEDVSALLRDNDASGSFVFLGRDAEEQAEIMEMLAADGHEIAFHSHRHHAYDDLSYDDAYDAITTGLAAIEDATGLAPDGFFAPFLKLSDGTVQAIEEVGFEWVLGMTDNEPDVIEITPPVIPFDTELMEEHSPSETMETLRTEAEADSAPFLFHPPVIEYNDGMDAFEEWIRAVEPVTVAEQIESGGTGMVLDCVRPVRLE
ncbi:polysaccharide deacetylase family protein [Natronorubrum aibiense]|uniref:Polysaccharide deacetylase family protein n=1 Tax=Natronorubrum aibiense TaxID=348826 RepID=A0A5P9P0T4_9EURY|nr:polysaccharide deacetylase family protein [Natronorubrum aibiense]QFU81758.1 polysaccharide deacetylase family protein [Natronorubrum aibiense]